jgi:hypothetical protein
MAGPAFDPIAAESLLVQRGVLPPRGDPAVGPLGDGEASFTEFDPRLHALWRVSMARQLHPDVLVRMPESDLLYLAGQSAEGYPSEGLGGIRLERNKVAQNALRARAELDRRAGRVAFRRTIVAAVCGAAVGAALTVAGALLIGGDDSPAPSPTTTSPVTSP